MEPERLLAVLSLKTFLVWVPVKRIVVKTPFIKLKERCHGASCMQANGAEGRKERSIGEGKKEREGRV